eukprot:COSAG02_NODE_21265_length_796_cov_0.632712_1_plen_142_part_10
MTLGQHAEALLAADRGRSRALADLLLGDNAAPAPAAAVAAGSDAGSDADIGQSLGRTRSAEEMDAAIRLSLGESAQSSSSSSELRRLRSAITAADALADWPAVAALAAQAEATLVFYAKDGPADLLYIWVVRPPSAAESTEE